MVRRVAVRTGLVGCVGLACGAAQGGVVYGDGAMAQFDALHNTLGGVHLDFEDKPAGTNLMPGTDPWGAGARFASVIYTNGAPFGPEHVEVSNRHHSIAHGNTIVGSPFAFGSDDGRVGYEIVFDQAMGRVGIERVWNTEAATLFYNEAGELLALHQNTVNTEFVGWFAEEADGSDRVKRILMDTVAASSARQVGYSDDLYFGLEVPAPGAGALLLAGLAAAGGRTRGRQG